MITLTYALLQDPQFGRAFSKLATFSGYKSMKTVHNLAQIGKKVNEEFRLLGKLHLDLVKRHAELDEKGELIPRSPGEPNTYKIRDEVKEEWLTAIKDFNAIEVKIDRPFLTLDELVGVPLSPVELEVVEPLMKPSLELLKDVKGEVKEIKPEPASEPSIA